MTGSRCWRAGTGWRPARHRSLAAAVEWSYQLLDEDERRVFRAVSVFPGPFTLEAAEAVAGPGAGAVVLRLVDCSLLVPPRAGPDGRSRYAMLETLRAYGAGLLAGAGEQDAAAAALARYALEVAEQAAAGLQTVEGELAAARWLDAEDATMAAGAGLGDGARRGRRRCGWRPRWAGGGCCGAGWRASTRCCARLAGRAEPGSDGWCAAQFWLGCDGAVLRLIWPGRWVISPRCGTRSRTGGRPGCWPTAWPAGRRHCQTWAGSPRRPSEARRALAMARELGYPAGEALALDGLGHRRLVRRRPGRRRAAGPAGRADHRRHPRLR